MGIFVLQSREEIGAADQIRTGDLLHGKQTLYQLSYNRMVSKVLSILKVPKTNVNDIFSRACSFYFILCRPGEVECAVRKEP